MFNLVHFFIKSHLLMFRTALWAILLALCVGIVYGASKPPHVIQLDPITKVIELPVEKLTTKTVTEYVRVEDRAAVNRMLKDNDKLKSAVEQLTLSLAEATSRGSGPVIVTTPTNTTPPTIVEVPQALTFKDWRLDFQSDGKTANYVLSQKFSLLNTVGRDKNNTPINIVRLFEIGEGGERLSIPVTETTTVAVMPEQSHFYRKLRLQGGMGVLPAWENTTTQITTTTGVTKYNVAFAFAISWLHRGTTTAAEHTRYTYLTPSLTFTEQEYTIGVTPITFNLGTVKRSPVTDIWIGPYLGLSLRQNSTKKFGIIFVTTF